MMRGKRVAAIQAVVVTLILALLGVSTIHAQQPDSAPVIQKVDAAVKARIDGIASYTVTEHYAVYRGNDATHPAAEMTVKTDYRKETGKSYTILSESGSGLIRTHVLKAVLEQEKTINLPGVREHSWFTSANYQMQLKPGGVQKIDGRDCLALEISPRRKATNMIDGTLWVDANTGSIVRLEGIATQSPSIFTGAAKVMRQYVSVNGFGMATQARAISDSFILGRTTVTIDYRNYHIQLAPAH